MPVDLWEAAPAALSFWQGAETMGFAVVIQVIVVVILIVAGVGIFASFLKAQSKRDAEG